MGSTKGQWRLQLSEGHLRVTEPSGLEHVFATEDVPRKVDLAITLFGEPLLVLKGEPVKLVKIPQSIRSALLKWLGPPTFSRLATTQGQFLSLKLGVPLGLLCIASAIFLGPPDVPQQSGILDVIGVLTGAMFIAYSLLARFRPRRWNFLFFALYCLVPTTDIVWRVLQGKTSAWWLMFAAFCGWLAVMNLRLYAYFQNVKGPAADPPVAPGQT